MRPWRAAPGPQEQSQGMVMQPQHVSEWLQKLGHGVCCPQPAQQCTHKSLTQTFIITDTSQISTNSLPRSRAAPALAGGVPCQSPAHTCSLPSWAGSELCHSECVSPLLSSRGRFPPSGLKAHKSGAGLSCHSTASPCLQRVQDSSIQEPRVLLPCAGSLQPHLPAGTASRTGCG